jgi:plastocyanin
MKNKTFLISISICFALTIAICIGCKKKEIGQPSENEIFLLYKAFTPTSLTVAKGTTVKFTNKDNANHTATSSSGRFDSGKIQSGESWSYTFTEAGTYYFYCNYHSTNQQEQGAIIVQ